jgi:folate-binding protein YgfZ
MLTAQGRMITDMRVLELGDAIFMDLPLERTGAIKDHLERFVFAEDVQIEDVTETRAEIGVYGPGALDLLGEVVDGALPSSIHASAQVRVGGVDATAVASADCGAVGYDLIFDAASRDQTLDALTQAGAVRATAEDVEAIRVERGRPLFGVDMDTETIPLEAGIEDRAISRTKGCYVGQEVIVRVLDRGHGRVARRLVGLALDAEAAVPLRGAPIEAGGRELGHVTSAVRSPELGRPIAMGYVHRDAASTGTVVTVGGVPATVTRLPFI